MAEEIKLKEKEIVVPGETIAVGMSFLPCIEIILITETTIISFHFPHQTGASITDGTVAIVNKIIQ